MDALEEQEALENRLKKANIAKLEAEAVKLQAETRLCEIRAEVISAQLRINIIGVLGGLIAAIATVAKVAGS